MENKYVLAGILVVLISLLAYSISGFFVNTTPSGESITDTQELSINEQSFKSIVTGSTGSGDVSVELTPHEVENGKLTVDIAVNTHSVDLSKFDLTQITTLKYGGEKVNPQSAPTLSGHHSSGSLVFDVGETIKKFTITIKGIPQVDERVFVW